MGSQHPTSGKIAILATKKTLMVAANVSNIILKNTGANIIYISLDESVPSAAASGPGYPLAANEVLTLRFPPDREWSGQIDFISLVGGSTLCWLFA